MKMNKRLLSLILVIVMVLGMIPLNAIATDDTTPEVTHIEGCSAECANAEGTCACTCHTPAPVDDDPVDNCDNCDNPACTGCTPDIAPLSDGGGEEDPLCDKCNATKDGEKLVHEEGCPNKPLCDKCNATRNEDNTISHEPTCEKLQYVPTCTGKTGCPVENCPNQHCTGDENCPIENCECKQPKTLTDILLEMDDLEVLVEELCKEEHEAAYENLTTNEIISIQDHVNTIYGALTEPTEKQTTAKDDVLFLLSILENAPMEPTVETCEYCGVELFPGATHLTDCITNCTCTPVEGVHQEGCKLYVEPEIEEEPEEESDYVRPTFFANAGPLVQKIKARFATWGWGRSTMVDNPHLETRKTSTTVPADDGSYTLTLEAYATGDITTTVTKTDVPLDVILVLDVSGSMGYCMLCGDKECNSKHCQEKLASELDESEVYYVRVVNEYLGPQWPSVAYCDDCDLWAESTSNHFNATNSHTAICYVPFDGKDITEDKTITGTNAEKNYKGDSITTRHRQFYTACSVETKRATIVEDSANEFLTMFYNNAVGLDGIAGTSDDVNHRVAVTTFGAFGHFYYKDANGALQNTNSNKNTSYYQSAFLNAGNSDDLEMMREAISERTTEAFTETRYGMAHAVNIYKNNPIPLASDENGRNRVVVVLTDGAPMVYHTGETSPGHFTVGHEAVNYAYDLKNTYGATVYGIGIFEGADVGDPQNPPEHSTNQSGQGFYDMCNRFMHALSSNYPEATAETPRCTITLGSINSALEDGESYYLTASNRDELGKVFKSIYDSTTEGGTASTLDETAYIQDVVTDYFYIPEGADVTAYSMTYGGENAEGVKIWTRETGDQTYVPTVNGKTVTVSGFDYSDNYVGYKITADSSGTETSRVPRGKKLVLEIQIKPNADFLGGNEVPTNIGTSAVYHDGTVIEHFAVPQVNVPIKEIVPVTKPDSIYLSQQAEIPHIANVGEFRYDRDGDGTIEEDETTKTDGINNAFVDIVYTIAEKAVDSLQSGDQRLTYTLAAGTDTRGTGDGTIGWTGYLPKNPTLTDDKTYHVQINVNPSIELEDGVKGTKKADQATITVYKPIVTFRDKIINLGESVTYATDNYVSIEWKHGTTSATEEMGPAPVLTYTYDIPESAFQSETEVKVTNVKAGYGDKTADDYKHMVDSSLEMLSGTTIYRNPCDYDGCDMKNKTEAQVVASGGVNFKIHLNTFDLKIIKEVAKLHSEADSFVFHVTGCDKDITVVINVINGKGEITIKGLPIPSDSNPYTVSEDMTWSWRYDVEPEEATIELGDTTGGIATVTFTNSLKTEKWLGDSSYAKNIFGSTSAVIK